MNELIVILEAIGLVIATLIALGILIPLAFYLHKKRTTSNWYRRIEASIIFGLFAWWAHGWTDWGEMLVVYWMIIILCFGFLHLMLTANPVKQKRKSRRKKK